MNRTFGKREEHEYTERTGAYIVAIQDGRIAVVRTPKGRFLPGGGIEKGETRVECIKRECLEETGFAVGDLKYAASADMFCIHQKIGYFHPIQHYYTGRFAEKKQSPIESDHVLEWIEYSELKGGMALEMQNWAIEECWNK